MKKEKVRKAFGAEITREFKNEAAVHNAFDVLSDGGVGLEPIGQLPWSSCCATVIDKFGVCWWISI